MIFGDDLVFILTLDGDESNTPSHPENDLSVGKNPMLSLDPTATYESAGSIYYRIERRI